MTDSNVLAAKIQEALADVQALRPAEELAAYEQVLTDLTERLNAPDNQQFGGNAT